MDDLVTTDPGSGLVVPAAQCQLLSPDGQSLHHIPPNHVIHPRTGKVVQTVGSVALDPITQRLIFTTDFDNAEQISLQQDLIPFVPYPIDRSTKQPVDVDLRPLERRPDMRFGCLMQDPVSGQFVPICAVTIHPVTNTLLPVGGVHLDPVLGIEVPIEIGAMMLDDEGHPVPILAVTIDPETGKVGL